MADSPESDSQNNDSLFVWDEDSQLYFHASSGFYHDPNAGWYYSTKDGLYYKFENGNYVLLHSSDTNDKSEMCQNEVAVDENSVQDEACVKHVCNDDNENSSFLHGDESNPGNTDCGSSHSPENPPPPSEWLEDTLIDLYLSGYSNKAINTGDDHVETPLEMEEGDNIEFQTDANDDTYELEEGEWIPEDDYDVTQSSDNISDEGFSQDEENWRAQYGQVIQSSEEPIPEVPFVDLWDWSMVKGTRKDGKGEISRLVGRLMKRSAKLHPSVPSGGGLLKTAPICEVHLDLVRVTTGQVYKLQNPGAKFLASLSAYDSSNPTKDWGFPELSFQEQSLPLSKSKGKTEIKTADGVLVGKDLPPLPDQLLSLQKNRSYAYRDRAAERRALHGGFGVGPGQKNSMVGHNDLPSSPVSGSTEEAAAEALNMSFGAGSYARKILKSMGWKEGEALGKTMKGLVEPIQAEGNIGNAGLGYPKGRPKH
ncbi:G-patch domain containing protein [Trema orientale]|uniref:G-patch domain containing protein n=1 Tax=Trema orientale TaxID=63057 RepID=A0A2P5FFZ9_TREOI|nr:G-patch domain containing protein [Trema orientale]